jgi:hypothetical protein
MKWPIYMLICCTLTAQATPDSTILRKKFSFMPFAGMQVFKNGTALELGIFGMWPNGFTAGIHGWSANYSTPANPSLTPLGLNTGKSYTYNEYTIEAGWRKEWGKHCFMSFTAGPAFVVYTQPDSIDSLPPDQNGDVISFYNYKTADAFGASFSLVAGYKHKWWGLAFCPHYSANHLRSYGGISLLFVAGMGYKEEKQISVFE